MLQFVEIHMKKAFSIKNTLCVDALTGLTKFGSYIVVYRWRTGKKSASMKGKGPLAVNILRCDSPLYYSGSKAVKIIPFLRTSST